MSDVRLARSRPPVRIAGRSEKLRAGGVFQSRAFMTISGARVTAPDPGRLVHLQFRRFAGCPVCMRHLHGMARRKADLDRAGIFDIVFFYSTEEDVRMYAGDLPFAFVADPDRLLYREFAVHAEARALLDPRGWPGIVSGIARSIGAAMRGAPIPPLNPRGGRFGLPADILIGRDGRLFAVKYGAHVNDQWSTDELLALARGR